MPGLIDLGKVDVDFAASLKEADGDESKPDGQVVEDSEEVELSEDEEADPDDADDDEDSDDSEEEPDVAAIGELLVGGKLAEACKKLGVDPKIFKVNEAKFKAMRAGLAEANAKTAAAEQSARANVAEKQRLDAVLADAKREYGPLVDLKAAVGLGDFATIQELLIAMAPKGTSWETIKAGLDNAGKGVTPGELAARRELKRLKEEQAAAEAERQRQQATLTDEQLTKKNLDGATSRLKGTEFEGIPGAPEAMVRIISENWDYARNGLKVKAEKIMELLAADPVVSQLVELKKLKAAKVPKEEKKAARSRGRGAIAQGNERKLDPKARAERERQAAMAQASRLEAAQQRGVRRGMRGFR